MKLHEKSDEFRAAISGAANYFDIAEHIIEKDYWVTMLLKRAATFEYSKYLVFKGGTSLSKGYQIIKRFSEDIDLAVKPEGIGDEGIHRKSGEAIHKIMRKMSVNLFQEIVEGKESEKQRYKRVYQFPKTSQFPGDSLIHESIILEVNSFSNPTPTESVTIVSLAGDYLLRQFGRLEQEDAQLEAFSMAALVPERTLCEKILAIRRAYCRDRDFFTARIRHLYDIFFLCQTDRIQKFMSEGRQFEEMLDRCHGDDILNQKLSRVQGSELARLALFNNPNHAMQEAWPSYERLRDITYDKKLPDREEIAAILQGIGNRLSGFSLSLNP